MLVNLNEVLPAAQAGGYAVGLFNTVNLEMAKGVLAAAERLRSPVIIGTAEVLLPAASLRELADFLLPMARRAAVPVVVHFDHGLTREKIGEAMELGFTSVMADCSTLPFEENGAAVAEIVRTAHERGVTVEAELGHVGSNADVQEDPYTDPEEARLFAARTGCDALAVAIGTAHGPYRAAPRLDLARLREIRAAVSAPLVLHGGSGLSDQDFHSCVESGIAKVNIFTDINCAAAAAAVEGYVPGMGMTDRIPGIVQAVQKATEQKMRLFGSAGRA